MFLNTMKSLRSPSLLKSVERWNPPCFASRVNVPSIGVRTLTSPAVKRFRRKQLQEGGSNNDNHKKASPVTMTTTAGSFVHSFEDMDNNTLITVSALENHDARIEVLKRHIMDVDQCSREKATEVYEQIALKNRDGMALAALPYQLGILAGVTAAIGSIPMVFDLGTTIWFNEHFVTTEVPGKEDLETGLEVGSWAWNWMEPPLGTLSFLLLCLQFSRAQMANLGIKPYTATLKKMRGRELARAFPHYDSRVIMDFSETDSLMKIGKM